MRCTFGKLFVTIVRGDIMKIGIPIWNERVSPVFDTALQLMIVEFDGSVEVGRNVVNIPAGHPVQRAGFVAGSGVDVLICGAVSQQMEHMLRASGTEIYPWVKGYADSVLEAFMNGELGQESFFLPGCGRRGRFGRGGRHQGGQGRGRGRGRNFDM